MTEERKILSFREIFKKTWHFFNENFSFLAFVVLVVEVPIIFINFFSNYFLLKELRGKEGQIFSFLTLRQGELEGFLNSFSNPFQHLKGLSLILFLAGTLLAVFLLVLENVALFVAIRTKIEGEIISLKNCFQEGLKRFFSYLWVEFLVFLAVLGGLILLIIPGIVFYVFFVFAPLLVIFENLKGKKALQRSRQITKGYFGKVFGNLLLAGLIISLVNYLIRVLANFSFWFLEPFFEITQSIIQILFPVFTVFLYLELKKIQEAKAANFSEQ